MSSLAIFGGSPVREVAFPTRKCMGRLEIEAAVNVLESDRLSEFVGASGAFFNGGPAVRSFEDSWANAYSFKHAISTNSWSTGLQVCFGAIGISPGDEVICPPTTMSATASTVLFYGGIPVFADLDPNRLTIDPRSIESKITPRTKAIAVVHLFGCPADMDPILQIAKRHSLYVVEDAAQSPGVRYKSTPVGAIGSIGGFSLNYHKHIQTGEGGLIVTNDKHLAHKCQLIRNHGENAIEDYPDIDLANHIGSNYRYTELQAAIASVQFQKLPEILAHRQMLASVLDSIVSSIEGLSTQTIEPGSTHGYYMYPIIFDEKVFGIPRAHFVQAVNAELPTPTCWETTPLAGGYVKPLYFLPLFQNKTAIGRSGFPFNFNSGIDYDYSPGLCPNAESMYDSALTVSPLIREPLSESDIRDFSNAIEKTIDNVSHIRDRSSDLDASLFSPLDAINTTSKNP